MPNQVLFSFELPNLGLLLVRWRVKVSTYVFITCLYVLTVFFSLFYTEASHHQERMSTMTASKSPILNTLSKF